MTLLDQSGTEIHARVAGRVYREETPVVGDRVLVERTGEIPVVREILPRKSVLLRTSPLGRDTQIIASNVDTVLVICAISNPPFSHGFLCRALASAQWRGLGASIVINKVDLIAGDEDRAVRDEIIDIYGRAGYSVLQTSCSSGLGVDRLLDSIRGSTVVMTGPSGAGKTSIAKMFIPSLEMRIGELNPRTQRGRHTTVAARMLPLDSSTALIDTPGLRMFSIDHIPMGELQECFPEFHSYLGSCHFRNCLHLSEPGCAVKEAVDRGDISELRYGFYREFMEEKKD